MKEKTANIDILEEKEKRALENVKSLLLYSSEHEYFSPFKEEEIDDMNIVLNLVSTLIAENKELKEEKKNMLETYKKINPEKMKVLADSFNEKVMSKLESDYISKSVIEKKIEEYEKDYDRQDKEGLYNLTKITSGKIASLRELLDERNNTDEH